MRLPSRRAVHAVTTGTAPDLEPATDTNAHCDCCRVYFSPGPCPGRHELPCGTDRCRRGARIAAALVDVRDVA